MRAGDESCPYTLADNLDIAHQALSERFRRAYKNLITTTLLVEEDEEN